MERRQFLTTGVLGTLGLAACEADQNGSATPGAVRSLFPRLEQQTFINAAGGTPLGAFAENGIQRYVDFVRLGPDGGRGAWRNEVWENVRGSFARTIGANESEIGLVECTKEGEQLVIDGLDVLRRGGNLVTNDLHFSGSLHNLEGLRRSGVDVRVARADDNFDVALERMADAIDERTALVTVSLVSNVNGRIEPIADLARLAHDRGALLFADIIQAAGIIPLDMHAMGIDVAACSSYKWLFGIHGAGFLYVKDELQGTALPDYLFPGHARRNYRPWVDTDPQPAAGDFAFLDAAGAVRYQPGHVNYLGYAAVHEAIAFLNGIGIEAVHAHTTTLVRRLLDQIDAGTWRVITPEPDRSPILSLLPRSLDGLVDRLAAANVVVGVGGDMDRLVRISPAIYNTGDDVDRLADVLNSRA